MNWIVSFLLRAKHWHLFLLFFGMMLLAQLAMFSSMQSATVQDFGTGILPFFGVILLFALCFHGWLSVMESFLNSIVQPRLTTGLRLHRLAVIYPLLYLPI